MLPCVVKEVTMITEQNELHSFKLNDNIEQHNTNNIYYYCPDNQCTCGGTLFNKEKKEK